MLSVHQAMCYGCHAGLDSSISLNDAVHLIAPVAQLCHSIAKVVYQNLLMRTI